MGLKRFSRPLLRSLGYELVNYPDPPSGFSILEYLDVGIVFDVGANTGQYAQQIRYGGYREKIVSFEPITEVHASLVEAASGDKKWVVHDRCAIGDKRGEVQINIASHSVWSSILPMLGTSLEVDSEAGYVGKESAEVFTIDEMYEKYKSPDRNNFLKIDAQGYEKPVLDGAEQVLHKFAGVQQELSLAALYDGELLYDYYLEFFKQRGFVLWDIERVCKIEPHGRLMQFDALFVNEKYVKGDTF